MQKEEAQELTEKLDQEWKSIQALMVKKTPKGESADKPEEKPKVGFALINQQDVCFHPSVTEPDVSLFSVSLLSLLCVPA